MATDDAIDVLIESNFKPILAILDKDIKSVETLSAKKLGT
jgi:hypothetical protein